MRVPSSRGPRHLRWPSGSSHMRESRRTRRAVRRPARAPIAARSAAHPRERKSATRAEPQPFSSPNSGLASTQIQTRRWRAPRAVHTGRRDRVVADALAGHALGGAEKQSSGRRQAPRRHRAQAGVRRLRKLTLPFGLDQPLRAVSRRRALIGEERSTNTRNGGCHGAGPYGGRRDSR
jgi:hypothetical protein